MQAKEALRYALDVCRAPARAISRWKAVSGRKAVGCLPLYLPEEVLHAAGMLPVTVWGTEFPSATSGGEPPSACFVAAGAVAALRAGAWGGIDAWAVPSTCEVLRSEFEAAFFAPGGHPPLFSFVFPGSAEVPCAAEDLLDRMEAFLEWAGAVSGRRVSEGALDRSVRSYNENRAAFARLEERMAESPGWASGREYRTLAGAGMALPAEGHTAILRAVLARGETAIEKPRAKVFVGGLFAGAVLDALDAAGAALVGNDLALGHRYYCCGPADEGGDPCVSLVRRHLRREPSADLHGGSARDRLLERYGSCGADRMLLVHAGRCGTESEEVRGAAADFRTRGIPFLSVDVAAPADRRSVAARVEGFVHMR